LNLLYLKYRFLHIVVVLLGLNKVPIRIEARAIAKITTQNTDAIADTREH
jgi:hypothetical protein